MRVLAVVLMILFYSTAFAAPAPITGEVCRSVSSTTNLTECTYSITSVDNQTAGTEFSIITPRSYGKIVEYTITNDSDDFDYWFAKSAAMSRTAGADEADTWNDIFIYYETQVLQHSPDLGNGRNFTNRDTEKLLYFWMKNDDLVDVTGVNYLSVTYGW
jgi:hypothetical protein